MMSRWEPAKDIPEDYDRDPEHKFLHKIDSKDLQQYLDGKRSTVTAVCTKTWAPKQTGVEHVTVSCLFHQANQPGDCSMSRRDHVWFHWSPSSRRKSIQRSGLVPGKISSDRIWKPPYICLADSPRLAWELSGHFRGWVEPNWDLWEVWTHEQTGFEELYFDNGSIKEIRVYENEYRAQQKAEEDLDKYIYFFWETCVPEKYLGLRELVKDAMQDVGGYEVDLPTDEDFDNHTMKIIDWIEENHTTWIAG